MLQYDLMFGKGYALTRMGLEERGRARQRQISEKSGNFFGQNREKLLQPCTFCAMITRHYTRITMPFCALLGGGQSGAVRYGARITVCGGKTNIWRYFTMAVVSMKQLLEAGVHFGHQTRRWNPKMAKYIFTERNGIYIIDLQKTVKKLDEAYNYVKEVAAEGGDILFVGTKKQAQESIRDEALRCGMHYVNARWLGGMLTNFRTIRKRIDRMDQLAEDEGERHLRAAAQEGSG